LQGVSQELDPVLLHTLYQNLIAPLEDTLQGKERIIAVADGPLYSLPLELLVTQYGGTERQTFTRTRQAADGSSAKPLLGEYAGVSYLGDRYRFSYLPSLAALVSQRQYPKPAVTMARKLVAFADPIFGSEAQPGSDKTPSRGYSDATTKNLQLLIRSVGRDGSSLLPRLPETAEEVTAIAQSLGDKNPLYLRDKAQEHTAKTLNLNGVSYLLFSTHGLLGGEFLQVVEELKKPEFLSTDRPIRRAPLQERAQPALALTLVGDIQGEDGFLTMKEVIEDLDLNTDLVVLSACNTAGETETTLTGEGFVGMTRAFLYAGARQLVVSHWSVESAATRDLMTAVFQNLQKQPLAQALPAAAAQLRGSSVKLDNKTATMGIGITPTRSGQYVSRAHPFFWASFVVVGD
jgi:CHAT domain-containing protein